MSHDDELIALDAPFLWRPYTSSDDHERKPLFVVDRAEGAWLIGSDGRRLLDASGSWWCNNLGHGHPRLRKAIAEQTERLMHCTLAAATHEPAARLAAELVEAAPEGLTRVFYSDNGSTVGGSRAEDRVPVLAASRRIEANTLPGSSRRLSRRHHRRHERERRR